MNNNIFQKKGNPRVLVTINFFIFSKTSFLGVIRYAEHQSDLHFVIFYRCYQENADFYKHNFFRKFSYKMDFFELFEHINTLQSILTGCIAFSEVLLCLNNPKNPFLAKFSKKSCLYTRRAMEDDEAVGHICQEMDRILH